MNFYTLFHPMRKKRGRFYKTLLVMKLVAFLIFAFCIQVSAASFAQKITLNEKDAPLEKVFSDIKKQTGYIFFYENNVLNGTAKVSINVKDATLQEVLDQCFKGQPLVYTIAGNTIGVKKKEKQPVQTTAPAPPKDITGHVTDKQGVPLVSATVLIKRTRTGTLTDVKGNFTIRGVFPQDTLLVSYIGNKTVFIGIGNETVFNIVMQETTNSLDQVVVQAYGQTTNRLNTGNIVTVSKEEIARQPVMNPLQALEGRVAGLDVSQTSGYANAPFHVEIRGRSTIGDVPADPLYIIDGVPLTVLTADQGGSGYSHSTGFVQNPYLVGPSGGQSPIFSINPADIESITILKDADATAIYGSRGANGVIIINTKTGSVGKTTMDINVYQGTTKVSRTYPLLNTQQYLQMRREAFANDGITPNTQNAYDLLMWDNSHNTDWQKFLFGNLGVTTNAQLALTGGNKIVNFRIGAGYLNSTDITTAKGANQRGSLQFNLSHTSPDQRFNISFSNNYSVAENNEISTPGQILTAPDAPPAFDASGNLNFNGWKPADRSFPFGSLLRPYVSTTYFLNSRLSLKYEILKGLDFSTNVGYSNASVIQKSEVPIASQDPAINPTGSSSFGYNNTVNWIIEPQLKYNRLISKGKLEALLGASTQSVSGNGDDIQGSGYTNDNLLGSISNAPSKNANDGYYKYKYAAIFARINYNWEDKYIFNLTARRDGSSRFGPGKQFGDFGAVGAAWILTEENWLKNKFDFLSLAKIRASYGSTGNDQIGDYQYLTRWTAGNVLSYQGSLPAYIPTQHANPNYQWEINKKLELSLDLSFFRDRLNFEATWYQNRCNNQLVIEPLPLLTGFGAVTANLPADVQNRGIELTFNGKILDKKDFTWNLNFNMSANRNKLLAFPDLSQSPYAGHFLVGMPLNLGWALHYTGVDPQTGQYTYQDKNGDGVISTNYGPTGDLYPTDLTVKFFGGLGSNFRYKNWQLDAFFHYKKQIGTNAYATLRPAGIIGNNVPSEVLTNSWMKSGNNAEFARFTTNPKASDYNLSGSDFAYSDASYIRLTNLVISYSLPKDLDKKIGINNGSVFFKGQNLLLITKYKGADPETQNFGQLPPQKIFTVGIQINL